ncbi:MAG TPA: alpha/beta hydrolase-fold protein [Opitutaceae bacterium]
MKPTFTLHSPETGTDYLLYVVAPDETLSPGPWPTMLFMDGDDQFAEGVAAYRHQRKTGKVPPLLLVGVGYGASYTRPGNRRGRDYTPTAHTDEPTSGGGNTFLDFMQATLWPELARRYPVHPDIRGIAGHSLGSLLVLYALLREPPFFTHHLASAPSIWWDDRSILRLMRERWEGGAPLRARLYLCVGDDDTQSMTGDLTLVEQQLARHPFHGLRVISERFPDRDHYNVLRDAFQSGLAALFDPSAASI